MCGTKTKMPPTWRRISRTDFLIRKACGDYRSQPNYVALAGGALQILDLLYYYNFQGPSHPSSLNYICVPR
jgi:hypothetical protein